jgi:hypothetical protein
MYIFVYQLLFQNSVHHVVIVRDIYELVYMIYILKNMCDQNIIYSNTYTCF